MNQALIFNAYEKLSRTLGHADFANYFKASDSFQLFQGIFTDGEFPGYSMEVFEKIIKDMPLSSADIEFFRDGCWFDSKLMSETEGTDSQFRISELNKIKILEMLKDGYSVRLNEVQRFSKTLKQQVEVFSKATTYRVSLNSYFTTANQNCLKPHADDQSIFIIQISGSKLWYLQSDASDDFKNKKPTVVLNKGDVLYIPRGTVHSAICSDSHSLHLTLAYSDRSVREFLNFVLKNSALQNLLNQPLPQNKQQRENQLLQFRNELFNELSDSEKLEIYLRSPAFSDTNVDIIKLLGLKL